MFYPRPSPTTTFGIPVQIPPPTYSQPVISEPVLNIPGLQVRSYHYHILAGDKK